MSDEKTRVERLVERRLISRAEADEILQALARLDAAFPSGATPARHTRPAGLKAQLLSGRIGPQAFDRAMRRQSITMGVWFGASMAVCFAVMPWLLASRANAPAGALWVLAAASAVIGLLSGIPFAWFMHRLVVRRSADRLVRLATLVDSPIEPVVEPRCGQCPTCGAENSKLWFSRHGLTSWHWRLNPGLIVNELLLGQRYPAGVRLCEECGGSFVDCTACGLAIDADRWSHRGGFGLWRGLACPRCNAALPCIRNFWAAAIDWPLRFLPRGRPVSRVHRARTGNCGLSQGSP